MDYNEGDYIRSISGGNDYHESGHVFWREIDGYLMTMIEQDHKIYVEIRSGLVHDLMPMAVGEGIATIAEQENVSDCIINNASIRLSFLVEKLTHDEVEALIQKVVGLLRDNSIPGVTKCELCKEDLTSEDGIYIKVNHRLMNVHKNCYEKFLDDIEVEKGNQKGSILTGIIGATVFGAIGTLPWIIVGIMGWFASILGMAIGISANYGYNKFGGKQGKIKAWTLVIVLVIMVVSAGFVTQLYELFRYLNSEGIEGVSIIDGLRFIITLLQEDREFLSSFILNTGMGIAFGLFGSWRIIKASGDEAPINKLKVELADQ